RSATSACRSRSTLARTATRSRAAATDRARQWSQAWPTVAQRVRERDAPGCPLRHFACVLAGRHRLTRLRGARIRASALARLARARAPSPLRGRRDKYVTPAAHERLILAMQARGVKSAGQVRRMSEFLVEAARSSPAIASSLTRLRQRAEAA